MLKVGCKIPLTKLTAQDESDGPTVTGVREFFVAKALLEGHKETGDVLSFRGWVTVSCLAYWALLIAEGIVLWHKM